MYEKLPFYMAYPLLFSCDNDRAERMDSEYLKSLYPDMPRRILPYVEEECDRMEYENSMIYDQYPDKLQLKLMCGRVCDRVRKYEKAGDLPDDQVLRDLAEVLVFQELYRRRCDFRRRQRRFY